MLTHQCSEFRPSEREHLSDAAGMPHFSQPHAAAGFAQLDVLSSTFARDAFHAAYIGAILMPPTPSA